MYVLRRSKLLPSEVALSRSALALMTIARCPSACVPRPLVWCPHASISPYVVRTRSRMVIQPRPLNPSENLGSLWSKHGHQIQELMSGHLQTHGCVAGVYHVYACRNTNAATKLAPVMVPGDPLVYTSLCNVGL